MLLTERAGQANFLDVSQGLREADVQFFTLPWLQFSLSNAVKHVSVPRTEKGASATCRASLAQTTKCIN